MHACACVIHVPALGSIKQLSTPTQTCKLRKSGGLNLSPSRTHTYFPPPISVSLYYTVHQYITSYLQHFLAPRCTLELESLPIADTEQPAEQPTLYTHIIIHLHVRMSFLKCHFRSTILVILTT